MGEGEGEGDELRTAQNLYADHSHSIPDICTSLGILRATLYRYLDAATPPDGQSE